NAEQSVSVPRRRRRWSLPILGGGGLKAGSDRRIVNRRVDKIGARKTAAHIGPAHRSAGIGAAIGRVATLVLAAHVAAINRVVRTENLEPDEHARLRLAI